MLINRFKGCTNTIAGVLYFVHCHRENTGFTESHHVLSEVQVGSQKEIQVVAEKLKRNAPIIVFPQSVGKVAGIHWGLDSQQ